MVSVGKLRGTPDPTPRTLTHSVTITLRFDMLAVGSEYSAMASKDDRTTFVLEAEPGHISVTGNDAKFKLTDAEVATIASSANTKIAA
jgi:hypothetical protein